MPQLPWTQVAVVSDDCFYLLEYNAEVVDAALSGVWGACPRLWLGWDG